VIGLFRDARSNKKIPQLLMKNIRVMAVDNETVEDTSALANLVAKTITLEVTDAEAKQLLQAQDETELSLGLISKADLRRPEAELDADRKGEDLTPVAASPPP